MRMALRLFCALPVASLPWDKWSSTVESLSQPPLSGLSANNVHVWMLLNEVDNLDEAKSIITVRADIEMGWSDDRWRKAIEETVAAECQDRGDDPTCSAGGQNASTTNGLVNFFSKTWGNSLSVWGLYGRFQQHLGSAFAVAARPWTPIPVSMLPEVEGGNVISEMHPYIFAHFITFEWDNSFNAIWPDSGRTHFPIKLDYRHYPFDQQNMSLCINFDAFSRPDFTDVPPWDTYRTNREVCSFLQLPDCIEEWNTTLKAETAKKRSLFFDGFWGDSLHVSTRFVEQMDLLGFKVLQVAEKEGKKGFSNELCLIISVQRKWDAVMLRLFFPLVLLSFSPFAGFYLPLDQVMPRVSISFISYLSLAVFRDNAYRNLPYATSTLHWMDVCMFTVTQMFFVTVLENVLALSLKATFSQAAAKFVDRIAKLSFPALCMLNWLLLYFMGIARADPQSIMITTQLILGLGLGAVTIIIAIFSYRLPWILLKRLVSQIQTDNFGYSDELVNFDKYELTAIFKHMDIDGNGTLQPTEVYEALQEAGLSLEPEEEVELRHCIEGMCLEYEGVHFMDASSFASNFGKLVKQVRQRHCRVKAQQAETRKTQGIKRGTRRSTIGTGQGMISVTPIEPIDDKPGT